MYDLENRVVDHVTFSSACATKGKLQRCDKILTLLNKLEEITRVRTHVSTHVRTRVKVRKPSHFNSFAMAWVP